MALAYPRQALTYVLGRTGARFRDLYSWDACLGFSWPAWQAWVLGHPPLHPAFAVICFTQGVGLVSFSSMHAALAVMVALALWRFRLSRVPVAIFTALMLLSIPSEGGHYLVDVLAGASVGFLAWCMARMRVALFGRPHA
jgi:membrane-associated phospholipid phosphatase